MIISRTPYRISFFGGGTDYPAWYREHGGAVLATTIDKYCYLTVRYLPPFFDHRFRVVYSKNELCKTVAEIEHPAVRGVLQHMGFTDARGLEIHHDGDLPARSGIASSSSFIVGLLNALYALRGQMRSKHELALESIHVEQERLKENVGAQDQTLAAHGGFNTIHFLRNGEISVRPLILARERVEEFGSCLMLFFTGISRISSEIVASYLLAIKSNEKQLASYGPMMEEAIAILARNRPLEEFGRLLNEAWQIKRGLGNQVSNPEIDQLYGEARAAGALGGKIIGAGGGGFLLLFVMPQDQAAVRERLRNALEVPFKFESNGSQIIFYERPDGDGA